MKIHEALLEVMRAVPAVKKSDRNTQQNFSFRGIDSVLNAVGPQLRKHGVIVSPHLIEHQTGTFTTKNGTTMRSVTLLVEYTFYGPEGDRLTAVVPGEAADSGDKAYSKAMSVALRTALLQTLALPTDEPDPDSEVHERATVSEVELARTRLLALVQKRKLSTRAIAAKYQEKTGVAIQDETDAEQIEAFIKEVEETSE